MKNLTALIALALSLGCCLPVAAINPQAQQLHDEAMRMAKEGNLQEAIRYAERAVEADPQAGAPHGRLSWLYGRAGQYSKALVQAQEAAKLSPNDAWTQRNLGFALQNMGMCAMAIDAYKKSNAIKPAVENEINIAQCNLRLGKRQEAAAQLETLAKAHPQDSRIALNLSQMYLTGGNAAAAQSAAEKALELDPKSYEATYIMMRTSAAQSRLQESQQYAEKLLVLEPKNPEGYVALSAIYAGGSDNPQKAAALVARARREVPKNADVFFAMTRIFASQADRPISKAGGTGAEKQSSWKALAQQAAQAAVEAEPENINYRLVYAEMLRRTQDFEGAHQQAQAALKINPNDTRAQAFYQYTRAKMNDLAGSFKRWFYRNRVAGN